MNSDTRKFMPDIRDFAREPEPVTGIKQEAMEFQQRKGCTRNRPCPCGSGKKFKKCCWHGVVTV